MYLLQNVTQNVDFYNPKNYTKRRIMGELVIYENEMNKLMLGNLSKTSMNIFMTLCYRMKKQGNNHIVMSFAEIKKLSKYKRNDGEKKNFIMDLDRMTNQLLEVNSKHVIKKPSGKLKIYKFDIFPTFIIDEEMKTLEVGVNPDFQWLLNEFKHYTSVDLEEIVGFKSKYTKNLYRLLRQWKSIGKLVIGEGGQEPSIKDFRKKIGVKDSYSTKEMMRSCIDVAVAEINETKGSIKNLKCEKMYASRRGRPLSQLIFTWEKEEEKKKESEGVTADVTADSAFCVIKELLKDHPEFSEDNIIAITKAAKENNVNEAGIKERIHDFLGRLERGENIPSKTGYIISLMKNYNPPAEARNAVNQFNNFEQNNYDFDELEKEILENPENGKPRKAEKAVEKLSDIVKKADETNNADFLMIDGGTMLEGHEAFGYNAEKMAEGVKLIIEMMKSNS